jgi:ribosome-associated protein
LPGGSHRNSIEKGRCIIGRPIATQAPEQSQAEHVAAQAERLAASKKFAIEAARLLHNTRCHDVLVLDMAGVSPVTDFYVIATGTSARQMRSVCDDVDELGQKMGFPSFHRSGYEGETWIAVDYVDVVVHVFNQEARLYYDLENLWGEAKKIDWS